MQYTTTYRLSKPDYTDIADISVLNANFDTIDQQLAERVTLGTAQNITGSKIFSDGVSIKNNNDDVTQPSGFQQSFYRYRDKNNNNAGLIGFEHFENGDKSIRLALMDNSKNYKLVDIFNVKNNGSVFIGGVTPSVNSLNDKTIPTMEYLNSESKATYLVHRAGTETITGQKTFNGYNIFDLYGGGDEDNDRLRIRERDANVHFGTTGWRRLPTVTWQDSYEKAICSISPTITTNGCYFTLRSRSSSGEASYLTIVSDTDKRYVTASPTPDNAPDDAVVTKGYPKMVTTDTEQTILSIKTFVGGPAGQMILKSSNRSATSTTDDTARLVLQDANSNTLATIRTHSYGTSHYLTLRGYNRAGNAYSEVDFVKDDDGNATLHIPHLPSNALSTSVVDKDWVQKTGKYHDTAQDKDVYWNNLVHKEGDEVTSGQKEGTWVGVKIWESTDEMKNKWVRVASCNGAKFQIWNYSGQLANNGFAEADFVPAGAWGYDRHMILKSVTANGFSGKLVVMRNTSTNEQEIWAYVTAISQYLSIIKGSTKDFTLINTMHDALPTSGYANPEYIIGRA